VNRAAPPLRNSRIVNLRCGGCKVRAEKPSNDLGRHRSESDHRACLPICGFLKHLEALDYSSRGVEAKTWDGSAGEG
jgi:hypothetical protein